MMNLVRTVGVLLIVLVALFLAWRSARKAGVTRYPVPGVLSAGPVQAEALHAALAAYTSGSAAVGSGATGGLEAVEPGDRYERAALPSGSEVNDELAELIDRQPDEVASILRGWLADRRA
jgi:flagellar M-ring protein FliF